MKDYKLKEGIDYTIDDKGRLVFTAHYLKNRGYCCNNGCMNCPYPKDKNGKGIPSSPSKILREN